MFMELNRVKEELGFIKHAKGGNNLGGGNNL
jgi:hypothetical protein